MNTPAYIPQPSGLEIDWFVLAACNGHNEEIIRLLSQCGKALIDKENKEGWTALQYASQIGHTGTVELLLKNGADINKQNNGGWTALMEAACYGFQETVALLLEKGADINAKGAISGSTALCIARQNKFSQIAALLEQWPEKQLQRKEEKHATERAAIKKIILGGLVRPIPYKGPFKLPRPPSQGN